MVAAWGVLDSMAGISGATAVLSALSCLAFLVSLSIINPKGFLCYFRTSSLNRIVFVAKFGNNCKQNCYLFLKGSDNGCRYDQI